MIDLDILQIPGECIQICRGVKHPPFHRTMGLPVADGWFFFTSAPYGV
jgi:hypothetical protein